VIHSHSTGLRRFVMRFHRTSETSASGRAGRFLVIICGTVESQNTAALERESLDGIGASIVFLAHVAITWYSFPSCIRPLMRTSLVGPNECCIRILILNMTLMACRHLSLKSSRPVFGRGMAVGTAVIWFLRCAVYDKCPSTFDLLPHTPGVDPSEPDHQCLSIDQTNLPQRAIDGLPVGSAFHATVNMFQL
jgi:hypothetical protein